MPARKQCAFCGASDVKISNEHAWPNWIRALFPPTPSTIIGTRPPQQPITFHPRSDNMGVTVNTVCKPCNEGWMERLEAEVRPFLTPMIRDGADTVLSREQQSVLVRWAVKTMMVFEFTNPAAPFFSLEERIALCAGSVPRATGLWVARYEGAFLSTAVVNGLNFDVTLDGHTTRQPGSTLTMSMGQFVVQVLSIRPPEGSDGIAVHVPKDFAAHIITLRSPFDEPLR